MEMKFYSSSDSYFSKFTKIIVSTFSSKRASFYATYRRNQPFFLPDSIMFYISKNPSTSKCYQKMTQTCKYFFAQKSILVVPEVAFEYNSNNFRNGWSASINMQLFDVNEISSQFWITKQLVFRWGEEPIATVMPKIYQCDIKELWIWKQTISLKHLEFLASKCSFVSFVYLIVINDDDGTEAPKRLLNVFNSHSSNNFTSKTVPEIFKLPHFLNFTDFVLEDIPDGFDVETFYDYIVKNKKTNLKLEFSINISQEYKIRLQNFVNKILVSQISDFKMPFIYFPGIDHSSCKKLLKIYYGSQTAY